MVLVTIEMTEIQKPVVENSMFMLSDIPESPSMQVFFKSLREEYFTTQIILGGWRETHKQIFVYFKLPFVSENHISGYPIFLKVLIVYLN